MTGCFQGNHLKDGSHDNSVSQSGIFSHLELGNELLIPK